MRPAIRRPAPLLPSLAALVLVAILAGCGGEEHELEVVEGEPARFGDLEYNVQLTRFLNPNDVEDSEYLVGQPSAPEGQAYLGVFVRIDSDSDDEDLRSASEYSIVDIRGNRFEPIESDSPFALEPGGVVPAGRQLPLPDSPAALGPAAGGVLIFLVDIAVVDARPLALEIEGDEETASVQLDM